MGAEKKTLVEEAKSRMKRSKRKHQESLVEFTELLCQSVPEVVFTAADQTLTRIDWDMSKSSAFAIMQERSKWFLLGKPNLTVDEWKNIHETLVLRLKSEPEMSWKPFEIAIPSTIVMIWETV